MCSSSSAVHVTPDRGSMAVGRRIPSTPQRPAALRETSGPSPWATSNRPASLPAHRADTVEVVVAPAIEAGGASGPDEPAVRVEISAGPEREPPADLDVPAHAQAGARRQRGPGGDRGAEVAPRRRRQSGELEATERRRPSARAAGSAPSRRRSRRRQSTGEVLGRSRSPTVRLVAPGRAWSTTWKRRPEMSTGSMRTKRCFGAACHGNSGRSRASNTSCIRSISTARPLTTTLHASPASAS